MENLGSAALCSELAGRMIRAGEPLLAHEILSEGRQRWPQDMQIARQLALALVMAGALTEARKLAAGLFDGGDAHGDTLGILGRVHKEIAGWTEDARARLGHLKRAHAYYLLGFRHAMTARNLDEARYTGINAAATALLSGRRARARSLARAVRTLCREARAGKPRSCERRYWLAATLAEAELLLDQPELAMESYGKAADLAAGLRQPLSSTRRQARLLLRALGRDPRSFDECFPSTRIAIFAGHMIDRRGRATPRFPAAIAGWVRDEIVRCLDRIEPKISYSSAACGSDILFLEAMIARRRRDPDIEVHVILPLPRNEFKRISVDGFHPSGSWGDRFEDALAQATSVDELSSVDTRVSAAAFEYGNHMILGRALLRGRELDYEVRPIAVWNRRTGDGAGGTAWNVRRWRKVIPGCSVEVIDPSRLLRKKARAPAGPHRPAVNAPPAPPQPFSPLTQSIVAMLFADATGYSRIPDHHIPRFVDHFMGGIRSELEATSARVLFRNTWGDGLFLVFPTANDAGRFALDLRARLDKLRWGSADGHPAPRLRIALHAGPAFRGRDPVTGRRTYTGSHVSRAARIEPITPPGEVYASESFAALAAVEGVTDFRCDFVGRVALAKGYGSYRTYHVREVQG